MYKYTLVLLKGALPLLFLGCSRQYSEKASMGIIDAEDAALSEEQMDEMEAEELKGFEL